MSTDSKLSPFMKQADASDKYFEGVEKGTHSSTHPQLQQIPNVHDSQFIEDDEIDDDPDAQEEAHLRDLIYREDQRIENEEIARIDGDMPNDEMENEENP